MKTIDVILSYLGISRQEMHRSEVSVSFGADREGEQEHRREDEPEEGVFDPCSLFCFDGKEEDEGAQSCGDDFTSTDVVGSGTKEQFFFGSLVNKRWAVVPADEDCSQPRERAEVELAKDDKGGPYVIGKGSMGYVCAGRMLWAGGDSAVAIKIVPIGAQFKEAGPAVFQQSNEPSQPDEVLASIRNELFAHELQYSLHHAAIVPCFGMNCLTFRNGTSAPQQLTSLFDLTPASDVSTYSSSETDQLLSVLLFVCEQADESLAAILHRRECLSEIVVRKIMLDLAHALVFLLKNDAASLIHGDVKPLNILISYHSRGEPFTPHSDEQLDALQFQTKLCDFGFATSVTSSESCLTDQPYRGTAMYMSPQACRGIVDATNDVWSLGIVAVQMLTGRVPWTPLEAQYPSIIISQFRSTSSSDGKSPSFAPNLSLLYDLVQRGCLSSRLCSIIEMCLLLNSSDRPRPGKIVELLEHMSV